MVKVLMIELLDNMQKICNLPVRIKYLEILTGKASSNFQDCKKLVQLRIYRNMTNSVVS